MQILRKKSLLITFLLLICTGSMVFWSEGPLKGKHLLAHLKKKGLWQENLPLRLHLGCGQFRIKGYVNIDLPSDKNSVLKSKADYKANILKLDFPQSSVDEIRLQHVFEHFSRVTALALLTKWHKWLKVGGVLHIETPDVVGCAKVLVSDAPYKIKMGIIRHLAGDQAESWGFHVDHWFKERYEHTLKKLGFEIVSIDNFSWDREPYLANVTVIAKKTRDLSENELISAGRELLWESAIDATEKPTYEKWEQQFLQAMLTK
jgi:predicted SAM-dependent methyltransferase